MSTKPNPLINQTVVSPCRVKSYRVELVLALHVVLDEHDVVHGLLDLEGHLLLAVGVDLRRRADDGGEAAVEPVEVPLQLPAHRRRRGTVPAAVAAAALVLLLA